MILGNITSSEHFPKQPPIKKAMAIVPWVRACLSRKKAFCITLIGKRASDVMTQTNSAKKKNRMVEGLTLQSFPKTFLNENLASIIFLLFLSEHA